MPGVDVRYFPVVARILFLRKGKPILVFRSTIVEQKDELETDDLLSLFVFRYKGNSVECPEGDALAGANYNKMIAHLEKRCRKELYFRGKRYEPIVEVSIDLRNATVTAKSRLNGRRGSVSS